MRVRDDDGPRCDGRMEDEPSVCIPKHMAGLGEIRNREHISERHQVISGEGLADREMFGGKCAGCRSGPGLGSVAFVGGGFGLPTDWAV